MQKLLIAIALLACAAQVQAQTPAGRYWHGVTSNGGTTSTTSRVYVFGGTGGTQSNYSYFNDLWYYQVDKFAWTLAPTGRAIPNGRGHVAWSCGGGKCVAFGGTTGAGKLNETWYYTEATGTWSKVTCRKKSPCPSARMMSVMAYDSSRGYHVLFGGLGSGDTTLTDTHTFGGTAWTARSAATVPPARRSASAVFVPTHVSGGTAVPMNRVVLFGGQKQAVTTLCDMYSWSGNDWVKINATNQGPCVHSASMAWDTRSAASPRLIVANGFVDVNDTHNIDVWYFTFSSATSGTWTLASPSPCAPRREAMGALDLPSKKMVFFGGSSAPANSFNDTLVCL
jgi:hypothetical protein